MNYSELTQAIKDYTENTESTFVTNIPNFVRQAEERIFRDITIPELRRNVTGNVSAGNKYVARPDDFLATFSLAIINGTTYTYLLDKEVNFVREAYPDTTVQGFHSITQYLMGIPLQVMATSCLALRLMQHTTWSCIIIMIHLPLLLPAHLGLETMQKRHCFTDLS